MNKTIIPDEYWTGIGLLENECPWLVPQAIRRLEEIDMSNMSVLEFGSGGSTLFFARRAKVVVSLETSNEWFIKVLSEIRKKGLYNTSIFPNPECPGLLTLLLGEHYDLILIDHAGDRNTIMELVTQMDIKDSIIVIDNYYNYNMYVSGKAKVECYDDPHWNGLGTMIIFPDK